MKRSVAVLFAVVVCFGSSQAAKASMINGTLGFVPLGNTTFTGPDLGDATSVTIPSVEIVNAIPPAYGGKPNEFLSFVALGDSVTVNPLTFVPGGSETIKFDGFTLSLSGTLFTKAGSLDLAISLSGTLSGNGFGATPADFEGALDTPANGGAVDGSFTLSAPPRPVPEPATIISGAMLLLPFGSGAFRRLRKKLQVA
jgi:hypothetical protein